MRLRLTDRGRGNVINRNAIERKYINSRTDGRRIRTVASCPFIYIHTYIHIYIYLMVEVKAEERITLQKRGSESRYQGVGDRETSGRLAVDTASPFHRETPRFRDKAPRWKVARGERKREEGGGKRR